MNLDFTRPGTFIREDFRLVLNDMSENFCDFALLDPPYEDYELYNEIYLRLRERRKIPMVVFSYPDNPICAKGDQVVHWVKPISTKNTLRRYSSFVEAITIWHGDYFNQDLHWSARSGVFTDTLIERQIHPHQKPESLFEKIIRLHARPHSRIFDCFAGSQTTRRVCDRLGYYSLSCDIKDLSC